MRYKIGDLAKLFNLSTESIRHYERQGLIHPQKAEGSSYRYYQAWDMAVLSACRQYRALGFTLEESADMLGQRKPTAVLDELRGREVAIEQESPASAGCCAPCAPGAQRRRRPAP